MATLADDGTVWARWTIGVISAASDRGADADALWKTAGLGPGDGDARHPERKHLAVWEDAMRQLRQPGFPIEHAASAAFDDVVLGLACKTAATVGDAVTRLGRYLPLWNDRYVCDLRFAAARVDLVVEGPLGGLGRRCVNEVSVAGVLSAMRQCASEPIRPLRAHFRHPAPGDISAHEELFDAEVRFDSGWDGFELAPEVLELELSLADEGLSKFFTRELDRLVDESRDESITGRVRRAIARALPDGAPKIATIAATLGASVRTLQRQLGDGGTSFAQLIEETRRDLALELVASSSSLSEIAFVLGFSEPSAFHRAFKRWTGETPARYRAGGRGQ